MSFLKDKTLIKLCILQQINKADCESYHLVKKLNGLFAFNINNIYPIIYSLFNDGYIETYDVEESGIKEKYYTLSMRGREYFNELDEEFNMMKKSYSKLVEEDKENE